MKVISRDYKKGKGNLILTIVCECGNLIRHPNNKRVVKCSRCRKEEDLLEIKKKEEE